MLPALHSQFKPREGETQENSIVNNVYMYFVANINFSKEDDFTQHEADKNSVFVNYSLFSG